MSLKKNFDSVFVLLGINLDGSQKIGHEGSKARSYHAQHGIAFMDFEENFRGIRILSASLEIREAS